MLRYVGGFRDDAFQASLSLVRFTDTQRKVQDISDKQFRSFQPDNGDIYTADSLLKRFENRVCISGAVFRPGTYALTKGMKLSELIDKAQGVREDVYGQRGLIVRLTGDLSRETVPFDVSEVQKGQFDIVLQREDSVVIQDVSGMREKRFVRIYGEVQKSGEYDFNEKMSVSDLIFLAGGLKEAASESYIEISRRHNHEEATKERNDMVQLFRFNIDRNLGLQDSVGHFILKPYDYVYVRRAPSYFEQKTVSIDGEVLYPGQYSISSKDERISDLIRRAGGLKTHAYPQGATLLRKTNLQMQDTVLLNNLAVREDDKNKVARHLENGRVQLQLEKILENPGSSYDYHLNEGDRVMIPQVSEEVMVAGAIYNPIAMAYDRYKSVKYYIDRSGGFWDTANKKRVYVVYSDGTTKVTKGFLFFRRYPTVMPGSKIIVPQRQVKEKMEFTKFLAIASTFSTVAVAISAIVR